MLIDRLLDDLDLPDPDDRRGSPLRGSRLGACARQSAYALWPERFPPDPLPARTKLVFRFGDMIHEMVRREFRRLVPGQWGMEESRFHFRVALSVAEAKAAIALNDDTTCSVKLRVVPGLHEGDGDLIGHGLTLNLAEPALYIPTHLDGIADLQPFDERFGLASCEIKSMASRGFQRALAGDLDYGYRVQMAVGCDAAGLDTQMYVAVRKDTCHLLEVVYSRRVASIEVRFTKSSRMVEVYRSLTDQVVGDQVDWEAAEVDHPFEPDLLEQARARVRRLLVASPTELPAREYGPDFACLKCGSTGIRVCRHCKGTRVTKIRRKPCGPCKGVGSISCEKCEGQGKKPIAPLPWQCSYCAYVRTCWAGLYRLEITERPTYLVEREHFTVAGVVVTPPEPRAPIAVDPITDESEDEEEGTAASVEETS